MATLIGADWNRMIESFQDFIGFRRERLFNELDAQLFQSRDNFLIMLRRPRLISIDQKSRSGRDSAYGFDARKVRIVASKFELQDPWDAEALGEGGGTCCLSHFL